MQENSSGTRRASLDVKVLMPFASCLALAFTLHLSVPATCLAVQSDTAGVAPRIFDALAGEWEGSGVLMGQPARFEMRWDVQATGFARLTFRNAWAGEDGSTTPVLAAEATYLQRGSSALGVWVDDRPQRLTLEAVLTDTTVVTNWTAEAEEGRTEYVWQGPDRVVVRDFVYVDGSARLFAEATYRRVDGR